MNNIYQDTKGILPISGCSTYFTNSSNQLCQEGIDNEFSDSIYSTREELYRLVCDGIGSTSKKPFHKEKIEANLFNKFLLKEMFNQEIKILQERLASKLTRENHNNLEDVVDISVSHIDKLKEQIVVNLPKENLSLEEDLKHLQSFLGKDKLSTKCYELGLDRLKETVCTNQHYIDIIEKVRESFRSSFIAYPEKSFQVESIKKTSNNQSDSTWKNALYRGFKYIWNNPVKALTLGFVAQVSAVQARGSYGTNTALASNGNKTGNSSLLPVIDNFNQVFLNDTLSSSSIGPYSAWSPTEVNRIDKFQNKEVRNLTALITKQSRLKRDVDCNELCQKWSDQLCDISHDYSDIVDYSKKDFDLVTYNLPNVIKKSFECILQYPVILINNFIQDLPRIEHRGVVCLSLLENMKSNNKLDGSNVLYIAHVVKDIMGTKQYDGIKTLYKEKFEAFKKKLPHIAKTLVFDTSGCTVRNKLTDSYMYASKVYADNFVDGFSIRFVSLLKEKRALDPEGRTSWEFVPTANRDYYTIKNNFNEYLFPNPFYENTWVHDEHDEIKDERTQRCVFTFTNISLVLSPLEAKWRVKLVDNGTYVLIENMEYNEYLYYNELEHNDEQFKMFICKTNRYIGHALSNTDPLLREDRDRFLWYTDCNHDSSPL